MRVIKIYFLLLIFAVCCGCATYVENRETSCQAWVERLKQQSVEITGDFFVDMQHGDFIRPDSCSGAAVRAYGVATADGPAAGLLRREIDSTLVLFNFHWVINATVRVEYDEDGLILRILSVTSSKRVADGPNNSFKPTPLRGAA